MSIKQLELSNFVIKTDQKEAHLVEFFKDRIWPLFSRELENNKGETRGYFFHNVKYGKIAGKESIYGQLVRELDIKARQRFNEKKDILEPTSDSMLSDVSTIFILTLLDHKLFLIKEQPRSPNSKGFTSVLQQLVDEDWENRFKAFRNEHHGRVKQKQTQKMSNRELRAKFAQTYPMLDLNVNPLGSEQNVDDLFRGISLVKEVTVTILRTNNEDLESKTDLLAKHRDFLEASNARKVSFTAVSAKGSPLEQDPVQELVTESVATGGNSNFRVKAVSTDGTPVDKTDHDTRVKPTLPVNSNETIAEIASKAFKKLQDLVDTKVVKLARVRITPVLQEKMEALARELKKQS